MDHGYYWLCLEGQDPEVVEIDQGKMYRCGSDVTVWFQNGRWLEFGSALNVVSITGPLEFDNG